MLFGDLMKALHGILVAASIALMAPAQAYGQLSCSPAIGLTTCLPADNLWPSARGPFTWLAPADTTLPGTVTFGATTSWVYRPIGLTVSSAAPGGTTTYPVEHAVSAHLLATLGLSSKLSFDVAAPMTLYQSGAGLGFLTGSPAVLPRSASGDLRFGPTLALVHYRGLDVAGRFAVVAPTGSSDSFATFGSVTFAPGVSAAYRRARLRLGTDIGARLRKPVQLGDAVIGQQLSLGLGASYELIPEAFLTLSVEAFGLIGLDGQYAVGATSPSKGISQGALVPAEWLVSFATAHALDGKLGVRVGMGGAIPTGNASPVTEPALRSVAAITFTP